MLSELQQRNLAVVFGLVDANRDGLLTSADLDVFVGRLIDRLDLQPTSPALEYLLVAFAQWWRQICVQAGVDTRGAVTLAQYVDGVDRGLREDPDFLVEVGVLVDVLYADAVRPPDTVLGLAGMVAVCDAFGLPEPVAATLFEQLDEDGDGKVGQPEVRAAVRRVFLG
ncbi:hypothetical protein ABZX92_15320 [Lentzea sp. NPDC006480]|uniref:EF-hand domain-containing protein n=1 Tax=Lentzea sp. NPDC006480 TaxID=3157176 RepID=UPI0033BD900F